MRIEPDDNASAEEKAWADQPIEELAFRSMQTYGGLKSYDNVHDQYQSGFLDGGPWQAFRLELRKRPRESGGGLLTPRPLRIGSGSLACTIA